MSKSKNFIFTHNNYVGTAMEDAIVCRFIAYSKEIAPTTGTPHLQGYICFQWQKSVATVRRTMPGCDVRIMKGTIQQNDAYISKMTSPKERGDKPRTCQSGGDDEKERWVQALASAKAGKISEIPADIQFRYYNTAKRIAKDHMTKPNNLDNYCGIWVWGPSGKGKSHDIREAFPGCYLKPCTKWWDGYQGEKVAYLEDFDKYHIKLGSYLKLWADKWPFACEDKGGAMQLRPKLFVVSSNYRIEDIWDDMNTVGPLLNRFSVKHKEHRGTCLYLPYMPEFEDNHDTASDSEDGTVSIGYSL